MERGDILDGKIAVKKEFESCIRCLELEDKFKKLKEKFTALELDMEKKKTTIEFLEGKLSFLELPKLEIEDEVRILKERNKEHGRIIGNGEKVVSEEAKGIGRVVDLTEEEDWEDQVTQLLIENKVLDCEKKKAESEAKAWESKYKELELLVMELHGTPLQFRTKDKANEHQHVSVSTPCKELTHAEEEKRGIPCETKLKHGRQVKKRLGFAEESPNKKMAPSTPGGTGPPIGSIDIIDSDDDPNPNHLQGTEKVCGSFDGGSRVTLDKNEFPTKDSRLRILEYPSDEEVHTSTPKRRRASNIVTSESESDNDDNLPICRLKGKSLQELNADFHLNSYSVKDTDSRDKLRKPMTRRRLVRLGKIEEQGGSGKSKVKSAGPTNETIEGDEMEEDDSDSEGESLGGFIVTDSDISEGNATTNGDNISERDGTCSSEDSSGESENTSHGGAGYDEIISVFRRARKHKKWDFEADMLADFGKDPELCMKAVCALYRQQTSEEKSSKAAIVLNGRGFSQCDAFKGSALAEFLTDGDLQGDVKKSVEELQKYNPRGAELCRKLATHYSKQLFAIYKNEEDPFFGPQ
ncbi:protein IWS1-like protein A-like [Forsythia ovata]|uniref:Protein IWS1-like protein A-like n=1 Tax=Forsythia ovata TaxID=205694 RepID=A0ABD1X9S4_9LAMI